jgi:preprotein translocase subunit SecY
MLLVIEIIFGFSYCLLCTWLWQLEEYLFNTLVTSGDFEQDMMGGNRQWIPFEA